MLTNNYYRANRTNVIAVDTHDYLLLNPYMTSFSTFTLKRIFNTFPLLQRCSYFSGTVINESVMKTHAHAQEHSKYTQCIIHAIEMLLKCNT